MLSLGRREELRRLACQIFSEPYFLPTQKRTGERFLSGPLYGPELKSHWPLRIKELRQYWRSQFSTEIPLPGASRYVSKISSAFSSVPHPLSLVYRVSIGEWRRNRSGAVKKGDTKVTTTNLGKIGKK